METLQDQNSRLRRNVEMQSRQLVAHASTWVGRQAAVERDMIGGIWFLATKVTIKARSSYQIGYLLSRISCVSPTAVPKSSLRRSEGASLLSARGAICRGLGSPINADFFATVRWQADPFKGKGIESDFKDLVGECPTDSIVMVSYRKLTERTRAAKPAPFRQAVMNTLHVEEVFLPFEAIKTPRMSCLWMRFLKSCPLSRSNM